MPGCALIALTPLEPYVSPDPAISLSTDPPGARILVDRKDSGFVTPCRLALDPAEDQRIDFVREGFLPATRYLTPDKEVYSLLFREMSLRPDIWRIPLWLSLQDFLVPIKHRATLAPGRVHVKLERAADTPGGGAPASALPPSPPPARRP